MKKRLKIDEKYMTTNISFPPLDNKCFSIKFTSLCSAIIANDILTYFII